MGTSSSSREQVEWVIGRVEALAPGLVIDLPGIGGAVRQLGAASVALESGRGTLFGLHIDDALLRHRDEIAVAIRVRLVEWRRRATALGQRGDDAFVAALRAAGVDSFAGQPLREVVPTLGAGAERFRSVRHALEDPDALARAWEVRQPDEERPTVSVVIGPPLEGEDAADWAVAYTRLLGAVPPARLVDLYAALDGCHVEAAARPSRTTEGDPLDGLAGWKRPTLCPAFYALDILEIMPDGLVLGGYCDGPYQLEAGRDSGYAIVDAADLSQQHSDPPVWWLPEPATTTHRVRLWPSLTSFVFELRDASFHWPTLLSRKGVAGWSRTV